jgi:hypothetical protein
MHDRQYSTAGRMSRAVDVDPRGRQQQQQQQPIQGTPCLSSLSLSLPDPTAASSLPPLLLFFCCGKRNLENRAPPPRRSGVCGVAVDRTLPAGVYKEDKRRSGSRVVSVAPEGWRGRRSTEAAPTVTAAAAARPAVAWRGDGEDHTLRLPPTAPACNDQQARRTNRALLRDARVAVQGKVSRSVASQASIHPPV